MFKCPDCGHDVHTTETPNNPDVGNYDETVECSFCQSVWTVDECGMVWNDSGYIVANTDSVKEMRQRP